MTSVLCVAKQKGGVAKTTTVINLGAALADFGKKVLLVDLDPQGHLAEAFEVVADQLERDMSDVLDGSRRLGAIVLPAVRPNLPLAPSNIRLSDVELTLVDLHFREYKLKRALDPALRADDDILPDCPPHLGLLTVGALMAAHRVLIPMATEYPSRFEVSLMVRTIGTIRAEVNPGRSEAHGARARSSPGLATSWARRSVSSSRPSRTAPASPRSSARGSPSSRSGR